MRPRSSVPPSEPEWERFHHDSEQKRGIQTGRREVDHCSGTHGQAARTGTVRKEAGNARRCSESATILSTAITQRFRKSNRKKTSLLNYEGDSLGEDWEAGKSIIFTWQILFEHIKQSWPSAADLLSLMSFLTPVRSPDMNHSSEILHTFSPLLKILYHSVRKVPYTCYLQNSIRVKFA